MSLRQKFVRGGLVVSSGQVLSQGISAIRNIVVARLIATEADFGIGSTLILIVTLTEMLSNLGMTTLIVQDRDGDSPRFLDVVHYVSAVRGLIAAATLAACSYPLAFSFGIPEATWAFAVLAAIPALRGLVHLDTIRLQRSHTFVPGVLQDTLSQFIALAACAPLLYWFRDYSAILFILLFQTATTTVLSHILASRPYRWARDRVMERRVLAFGIPLLLSGTLTFMIMQGERFVLGSSGRLFGSHIYPMEDMAAFSVAYMIATLLPLLFARVLISLFLPLLSSGEGHRFIERNETCIRLAALAALGGMIPFILFGDGLVSLLYGHRYAGAGLMVAVFAAGQALRLLRICAIIGLEAKGYTWDTLVNNLWRAAAFGACVLVALAGLPAPWIAAPAIAGELIATTRLAFQLRKRCFVPLAHLLIPLAFLASGLCAAGAVRFYFNVSARATPATQHLAYASVYALFLGFGAFLFYDLIGPALRRRPDPDSTPHLHSAT